MTVLLPTIATALGVVTIVILERWRPHLSSTNLQTLSDAAKRQVLSSRWLQLHGAIRYMGVGLDAVYFNAGALYAVYGGALWTPSANNLGFYVGALSGIAIVFPLLVCLSGKRPLFAHVLAPIWVLALYPWHVYCLVAIPDTSPWPMIVAASLALATTILSMQLYEPLDVGWKEHASFRRFLHLLRLSQILRASTVPSTSAAIISAIAFAIGIISVFYLLPYQGAGLHMHLLCAATLAVALGVSTLQALADYTAIPSYMVHVVPTSLVAIATVLMLKRASLSHLPCSLRHAAALRHSNLSVRTVACLSIAAETTTFQLQEAAGLVEQLHFVETLSVLDLDGLPVAAACQAYVALSSFDDAACAPLEEEADGEWLEKDEESSNLIGFGLWLSPLDAHFAGVVSMNRRQAEGVVSLTLVLAASPHPNHADARYMAATTAIALYSLNALCLRTMTFLRLLCTLCSRRPTATTAIHSLQQAAAQTDSVLLMNALTSPIAVQALAQCLTLDHVNASDVYFVARVLSDVTHHIEGSDVDPRSFFGQDITRNLRVAWDKWHSSHYFIAAALERAVTALHAACDAVERGDAARTALAPKKPRRCGWHTATIRPTTWIDAEMWQDVQARQNLRDQFVAAVARVLDEGWAQQLPPSRLSSPAQAKLLEIARAMRTHTFLLGHLHETFPVAVVAYVRQLDLLQAVTPPTSER